MSFQDRESGASDSDEASELPYHHQPSALNGELVTSDRRRTIQLQSHTLVQAHVQAQIVTQEQGDRPAYIVNHIYGSVTHVYNPIQNNSGSASGHQGHIAMCKSYFTKRFRRYWRRASRSPNAISNIQAIEATAAIAFELTKHISAATNGSSRYKAQNSATNGAGSDQDSTSIPDAITRASTREATPSDYIGQPPAWFREGRYFSIWAPNDHEIHEKTFILLDTQNTGGKGVLVKTLDTDNWRQMVDSSTSYRTRMLLKGSSNQSSSRRPSHSENSLIRDEDMALLRQMDKTLLHVYMDEFAQKEIAPGTVILLSHIYNIPFMKYKCVDHGIVSDESLEDLRFHYIQYLTNTWHLTRRARQHYCSK